MLFSVDRDLSCIHADFKILPVHTVLAAPHFKDFPLCTSGTFLGEMLMAESANTLLRWERRPFQGPGFGSWQRHSIPVVISAQSMKAVKQSRNAGFM